MSDPKDQKNNRIVSNAPDIIDPDEIDENEESIQDQLEDSFIEADERIRRKRYHAIDDDESDIASNAPNITDIPPREDDERH